MTLLSFLVFSCCLCTCFSAFHTKFYLYRRSEPTGALLQGDTLPSNFDRRKPTVVVVHGVGGHSEDTCTSDLTSALVATHDANVIVSEFSRAALGYTMFYRSVAQEISTFLKSNLIRAENTVVMGMSLGAQISGILYTYGFRPDSIIGMDPAGPQFESYGAASKLTRYSANSVQAVHSNAGGLGTTTLDGHLDVFINKGTDFPCCTTAVCRHLGSCHWVADTIRQGPAVSPSCVSHNQAKSGYCTGSPLYTGFGAPTTRSVSSTAIAHVSISGCVGK